MTKNMLICTHSIPIRALKKAAPHVTAVIMA